jgi:amidohydrolase
LTSIDRDQEDIVTSALTLPTSTSELADLTADWPSTPPGADPLPGQLDRWLLAQGAELIAVRRHLHSHPELSGQEFNTANLIMQKLTAAGLAPVLLPKRNGVICDIPGNGTSSGIVALRADLDALPLPDTKDVPYRSTVDGVCHACGHDVHTTILLGVGLALAQLAERGELPGTVRLIFQPAEETTPSGAPEVIAAGGLKGVSFLFGLHCAPQLPVGLVGVRSGPFTAAADLVEVRLHGTGGHTARPHLTQDLVHALGRVVVDVPALLDRRIDPRAGVSMVFGAVRAGEAANAIPMEGYARATVRVLSQDAWRDVQELVTQLIHDVVAGTGARATVDYRRGVPPIINDRLATAVIAGAAAAALGPDRVVEAEISMGGEDFAFYLEQVPGSMIRLGVGVPGSPAKLDIHQSAFDVDERAISHGVRVMVHTALAALATPGY